jgi:FixJ family two-component response regulator
MENAGDPTLVCIIDDDPEVLGSLDSLLRSAGLAVRTYPHPDDYLAGDAWADAACLILDVNLDNADGLAFQRSLAAHDIRTPVILITGNGSIPMTVLGMKAGAVNVLPKPFDDEDLVASVMEAVEQDRQRRSAAKQEESIRRCYQTLTPRERDVMGLVAAGLMNKQVAAKLGLSEITIKIHRGNLMRKMRAQSLADLVRMAEILGVRDCTLTRYNASAAIRIFLR